MTNVKTSRGHEEYRRVPWILNAKNKGIIKNPKFTNVDRFIQSAKKFFPDIEKAEHIGSMFTIRTVLPYKDKTDERPSIVTRDKNNFILFSGKIGNCIESANTIEEIIKS